MPIAFFGLVIYLLNELVYDQFGALTVNWMVSFYAVNYLAITLLALEQWVRSEQPFLSCSFAFLAIVFLSFIFIELSFWNASLEVYIKGLDNKIISNFWLIIGTFFFGFITFRIWGRQLKNFYWRLLGHC